MTPQSKREVFEVHVAFEVDRLLDTYELLLKPDPYRSLAPEIVGTLDDALIVAFCTHARNLLEFFYRKCKSKDPASGHFAERSYTPLPEKDVRDLKRLLNNQINHLGHERTDEDEKKIDSMRRKELVKIIYNEAVRLAKSLKQDYDAKPLRIEHLARTATMDVPAGAVSTTGTTKWGSSDSTVGNY